MKQANYITTPVVDCKTFFNTLGMGLNTSLTESLAVGIKNPSGIGYKARPYTDELAEEIKNGDHDAYFCVSTLARPKGARQHGLVRTHSNAVRAIAFVLDDIGTKVKTPPTLEPSWKIETSPGNFQWGYFIAPETDLDYYEACVRGAADAGLTDAGANGRGRLMRVPGSVHSGSDKDPSKKGFVARITHWDDLEWSLNGLVQTLGITPRYEKLTKNKDSVYTPHRMDKPLVLDPFVEVLEENDMLTCETSKGLGIVCPFPHESGAGSATSTMYFPLGVGSDDAQLEHRAVRCFHGSCAGKKSWEFIEAITDAINEKLGTKLKFLSHDPLPVMLDRYALLAGSTPVVVDTAQPVDYPLQSKSSFDAVECAPVWTGEKKPVKKATLWWQSPDKTVLRRQMFDPSTDAPVIGDTRNLYQPVVHPVVDGLPRAFLKHLMYLIPDRIERHWYIRALAHKLRYPGERPNAVVMYTPMEGTGRGQLARLLDKVWGSAFVENLDIEKLVREKSQFNGWVEHCLVAFVNEAHSHAGGDLSPEDVYEKLKAVVDNIPVKTLINPKYGREYTGYAYFWMQIFTNNFDALSMGDTGDARRLNVLSNAVVRHSGAGYYERLADMAVDDEEAARVYWFLMGLSLDGFDHTERLDTEAKRNMKLAGMTPAGQLMHWVCTDLFAGCAWVDSQTMEDGLHIAAGHLRVDGGSVVEALRLFRSPSNYPTWNGLGSKGARLGVKAKQVIPRVIQSGLGGNQQADAVAVKQSVEDCMALVRLWGK